MNVCYWVNCYTNVNIRSIEFCAGKFRAFFYRIGAFASLSIDYKSSSS